MGNSRAARGSTGGAGAAPCRLRKLFATVGGSCLGNLLLAGRWHHGQDGFSFSLRGQPQGKRISAEDAERLLLERLKCCERDFLSVLSDLACFYSATGRQRQAQAYLERCIANTDDPEKHSPGCCLGLGQLMEQMKDFESADFPSTHGHSSLSREGAPHLVPDPQQPASSCRAKRSRRSRQAAPKDGLGHEVIDQHVCVDEHRYTTTKSHKRGVPNLAISSRRQRLRWVYRKFRPPPCFSIHASSRPRTWPCEPDRSTGLRRSAHRERTGHPSQTFQARRSLICLPQATIAKVFALWPPATKSGTTRRQHST